MSSSTDVPIVSKLPCPLLCHHERPICYGSINSSTPCNNMTMTIKTKWIGVDGHGYNISIYIYKCGSHIMNSAHLELIPPISRKHTCGAHRSKCQRAPTRLRTGYDVPTVQDSLPIQDPTPAKGCWLSSVAMITGEYIDTYKT